MRRMTMSLSRSTCVYSRNPPSLRAEGVSSVTLARPCIRLHVG
jgi:hypothetical protein